MMRFQRQLRGRSRLLPRNPLNDFVLLMSVLLLNFLIAILSGTYEQTQAEAHLDHFVDLGFAALRNRCARTRLFEACCCFGARIEE